MKTLSCRLLSVATLTLALSIAGYAQTRSIEHDFSPFDGIEVTGGFKVSIAKSETYSAKLTVDDALESYVECYVRSGVLHIGLEDKKIPKDVKKQYKGKNSSDPTLVAVVYLPSLNSLSLDDESEFYSTSELSGKNFALTMKGSSAIKNLKLTANTFKLNIDKNAKFTNASVTTENDIVITSDGKAAVTMEFSCSSLNITGSGNTDLAINGKVEGLTNVVANGSAKISLSGTSGSMEINGKGSSGVVDASSVTVDAAKVSITGLTAKVSPATTLELDLGKGAEVDYAGDPTVKIVKIQNASVIRTK